jgi:7,8-dihydro-6-hydroxymethylpterin dimethyltransferase
MLEDRDYLTLESTITICPKCNDRVDGKIIEKDGAIYILKNCLKHGQQLEILEESAEYHHKKALYNKPGTICKTQTKSSKGCPFDCGLCPDHEQHTCIGLIEVTNKCDLCCPTCYANSGKGEFMSLKKVEEIMDFYMDSESGHAEILQISGGEPTTHPEILDILELAMSKGFKYVMLNTNGIRIANDEGFVKELARFRCGFEIYLQFDGLNDKIYKHLRGRKLIDVKKKAISLLTKHKIPITLVSTIEAGVNDQEIGKIVKFAFDTDYIRGINFQPVAFFGRLPNIDTRHRITLSGILKNIESQTKGAIGMDDFVPLPCDVDRAAIGFFTKKHGKWRSVAKKIDVKKMLPKIKNTFAFDLADYACSGGGCCNSAPKTEEHFQYVNDNFFRISVKSFIDVYNFDVKSVKKDCVHILTADMKKMPFSTYNMFYRPLK